MVVTCDIEFENNPEAVYYAGQVITGKVTLTADKVKQVKTVNLKVSGTAETRWKQHRKWHYDKLDYISTATCLLAPTSDDQAVVIEPGIHTFSFACHLPLNAPPSVEGDFGSIRYVVQVVLERPWKFNHTFSKCLTVLSIMDLNDDRTLLQEPVKTDFSKTICCGPCKSDSVEIHVNLPQRGYVPGQLIPINLLVTNNTLSNISEICSRLVMIIQYFTTNRTKSTMQRKTVSKLNGDPVLRNSRKNFNYLLPIPATPPTTITECKIIQITYQLEVEAKVQGIFYRNVRSLSPVTIFTIPTLMEGMVIQQQPTAKRSNFENIEKPAVDNSYGASTSNENKEPWASIGNISRPVYMEASHLRRVVIGEERFDPKYPVFVIPSSTTQCFTSGDEVDSHAAPSFVTDPDKTTWL